jgi:hypothetical protein
MSRMSKSKITSAAGSRIQFSTAKSNGGTVSKVSFASRATSAAAKKLKKINQTRFNSPTKS